MYAGQIGRDYGIVAIASLALFWSVWWEFACAFLLVQAIALLVLRFGKCLDPVFLASTMISILLQDSTVVKTTDDFIIRSE
jgi:uncharacterized protein involved in exopolysaccharide biosynthesis